MKTNLMMLSKKVLILILPLLIFSTLGCQSKPKKIEPPEKPDILVFQPLIEAKACIEDVCEYVNVCKVWARNEIGIFELKATLDVSACSYIFGVSAADFNKIRNYMREVDALIGSQCGPANNGKP